MDAGAAGPRDEVSLSCDLCCSFRPRQAMPEGAGQMNDLFIAESVNLSIDQVSGDFVPPPGSILSLPVSLPYIPSPPCVLSCLPDCLLQGSD